jgi:ABC-type multidrug transport system fused ATPase/permease subunit
LFSLTSALDSGILRFSLDLFGLHDDSQLWEALKRSYAVKKTKRMSYVAKDKEGGTDGDEDQRGTGSTPNTSRLTLDSAIEVEGSSLSIGQRFLLSLASARWPKITKS